VTTQPMTVDAGRVAALISEIGLAAERCREFDVPVQAYRVVASALGLARNLTSSNQMPAGASTGRVVCLCGPARFAAEWRAAWIRLVMAGHAVVGTPDLREELGELTLREEAAAVKAIQAAHFRLIDASDELHIVSRGGYYGDNTRDEIAYALEHGKRVTYLEAPGA
jgi:hypothetical protein